MYKDYRKEPFAQQSRGLRNNNPMNLRPFKLLYNGQVGTDKDGHAIFENIIMGLRAGAMELRVNYKKGLNTLTKTIADFAPPNENNTNQYINYVSQQTGLAPNYVFTLNGQNVAKIMAAMIVQEIGSKYAKYITADEVREGIKPLLPIRLPTVQKPLSSFLFRRNLLYN